MSRRKSTATNRIRNIVFDFGGVLAGYDYEIFLYRIAHKTPLTAAEIRRRIHHSPEHLAFERGEISGPQFHAFVAEMINARINYDEFSSAWADIFWPEEPMLDLADSLGKRYELFLLSNTNEIHYTMFPHIPRLMDLIPRQGLSFKLGAMKPDLAIYKKFFRQFGLKAAECVFIDDLEANVRGAELAGMRTVHHSDFFSTRKALAALGIE